MTGPRWAASLKTRIRTRSRDTRGTSSMNDTTVSRPSASWVTNRTVRRPASTVNRVVSLRRALSKNGRLTVAESRSGTAISWSPSSSASDTEPPASTSTLSPSTATIPPGTRPGHAMTCKIPWATSGSSVTATSVSAPATTSTPETVPFW